MQLVNGSRVAIVGGGPAGSFTALHLLRFAASKALQLEIDIFEARDFFHPGPEGCNMCAGILSSNLTNNLKTLNLELPEDLILAKLDTYILHLQESEVFLQAPKHVGQILSVYRGSGPRLGTLPSPRSFDAWLLEQALSRGARLHRERVRAIRPGSRPVIALADREIEADLVVVATGVNSHTPLIPAWGYRMPRTEVMTLDEIPLPKNFSGNHVHIYFEPFRELIFGSLTPKGIYANISLLGQNLPANAVKIFLNSQVSLEGALQDTSLLCGCKPHISVSPAKNYYSDRMVAVGDSAVTRLYKDGLGAAFITAESAARTAINVGISKHNFSKGYRPTCRQIARDNTFGNWVFYIWSLSRRSPRFFEAWAQALTQEEKLPVKQQIHRRILWGIITGETTYQQIFNLLASWPALWQTGLKMLMDWKKK